MENTNSLSSKLKKIRKEQNITLDELHRRTKISISALSRYEKGTRTPKFEQIEKLSMALDVPVSAIFDFREVKDKISQQAILFDIPEQDFRKKLKEIHNKYPELEENDLTHKTVSTFYNDENFINDRENAHLFALLNSNTENSKYLKNWATYIVMFYEYAATKTYKNRNPDAIQITIQQMDDLMSSVESVFEAFSFDKNMREARLVQAKELFNKAIDSISQNDNDDK